MSSLRGLGVDVRGEKATPQDVTETYSDVQTQLASLEASHAQLLEIQKRASTVDEVLKVQQQADQIKLQIDRLKGRSNALQRLSDLATITLRAQPAEVVLPRDYAATLGALRKAQGTRTSLLAELQRTHTPDEVASLQDRLAQAVVEIDRQQAQADRLVAMAAAASVRLPTPDVGTEVANAAPDNGLPRLDPRALVRSAWETSLVVLLDVLAALAGAVVFLWWLLVPLALVLLILRRRGRLGAQ
jgi:hypothetical protein